MPDTPHHARPGPGTSAELEGLYTSPPPWDLGRPQPALQALAEAGVIRGRVLDVGCGTGEHTLMAADLGLDATGIDLASHALRTAQTKARDRGRTVRFLRHDARQLAELGESFDTVLDSLVFHSFNDEDRTAYVNSLHSVLKPGGRYFMLAFSDQQPGELGRPHKLTQDDIRLAFADGWRLDSIEPATIASTRHPDGIQGWLVALTKTCSSADEDASPMGATAEKTTMERTSMLTAEAHVKTERASRYLVQLCRHGSQMTRLLGHRPRAHGTGDAPPQVRHVEWSDNRGVVTFEGGQCTLEAAPEGLALRVEASGEEELQQIQDGIAGRIEKIGRRDNLKVNWQRPEASVPPPDGAQSTPAEPTVATALLRGRGKTIGLSAVGILVIAVHLEAGGALANMRWTGWAAYIVLAVALVKVIAIGSLAIRRRRAAKAR